MSELPQPYPLAWPDGMSRSERRATAQFRTKLSGALDNVRASLTAFGKDSGKPIGRIVMSSNVTIGDTEPKDPGVAVWFEWDGTVRCIAVDRYPKPEHNLQAIHHVLEARRTELRHAGIEIARAAFSGFQAALPSPERAGEGRWWEVLGVPMDASAEDVHEAWKRETRRAHEAGDDARQRALNVARDEARKRA